MPEQTSSIISKVWGMCNPLRDDGLSYGDYLEQLTYLIFLKMSDEYSKPPYRKESGIPAGYTWQDMNTLTGAALEEQYKDTLEKLGEQGGILGQIFKGAINKVSNAAILYRIVQMIDREKWVSMSSDVKGEIYEGLLQKNAEDVKSGAGQYFTPRADPGDGRLHPPRADENDCGPLLRQRGIFPRGAGISCRPGELYARSGAEGIPEKRDLLRK